MCCLRHEDNICILFSLVARRENAVISHRRQQEQNLVFEAKRPHTPCCVLLCITEILYSHKCELLLIASICPWHREIWGPLIVQGLSSLHLDLLWRDRSQSRKYGFLQKPCMHFISSFLRIIRWIHLPRCKTCLAGTFLTFGDISSLARVITQGALPGPPFDGLHAPGAMLTSARYLSFHSFVICFLYFMTASLGIYFPRKMTRMIYISP